MDKTKAPLESGMEQDALTRNKKYFRWNAGVRKAVKRAYNKRNRKYVNQKIRQENIDILWEGEY